MLQPEIVLSTSSYYTCRLEDLAPLLGKYRCLGFRVDMWRSSAFTAAKQWVYKGGLVKLNRVYVDSSYFEVIFRSREQGTAKNAHLLSIGGEGFI
jgi:hypothetical protein